MIVGVVYGRISWIRIEKWQHFTFASYLLVSFLFFFFKWISWLSFGIEFLSCSHSHARVHFFLFLFDCELKAKRDTEKINIDFENQSRCSIEVEVNMCLRARENMNFTFIAPLDRTIWNVFFSLFFFKNPLQQCPPKKNRWFLLSEITKINNSNNRIEWKNKRIGKNRRRRDKGG